MCNLPPQQPRRNHPAVVQHQHIARAKQFGKLAKPAIAPLAALAIQLQHPRARPLLSGLLRNQLVGKVEVEIGNQHGVDFTAARRGDRHPKYSSAMRRARSIAVSIASRAASSSSLLAPGGGAGTLWAQLTATRENGRGIMNPSHELATHARCGST